ncbi:hypothetical protein CLV35_1776 [Motilibacter peucedani]|uniref:Uncharacterized protein n=2 Tax=Motilibacter peucedani TaxID=598650 RepID=A0A420XQ04_9ACTN|nr:hypothetical protein CLV35_1776 [Motilibacter peucedani]
MIEVDPTDPALMDALRVYAAWSICVEIHGDGPGLLASMDDSGRSICAELTVTEAQDWRSSVNGCVAIEPLEDTHRRRRQSRWRLWRRRQ